MWRCGDFFITTGHSARADPVWAWRFRGRTCASHAPVAHRGAQRLGAVRLGVQRLAARRVLALRLVLGVSMLGVFGLSVLVAFKLLLQRFMRSAFGGQLTALVLAFRGCFCAFDFDAFFLCYVWFEWI